MIRPEVVRQLDCPLFGLATSWIITRKGRPADSLEQMWREFRRETWPFSTVRLQKDDQKARKLREEANEFYRKNPSGEMERVLRMYNEAICWAREGSEEAGMALGNRSAIYFQMGQYGRCLANVDLAKANGYPDGKMEKLDERKRKCLEALGGEVEEVSEGNVEADNIMENCQLTETKECGRSLTSKEDLRVGKIVVKEHPLLVVVEPETIYRRCNHCGSMNELDLIACRSCVSAMYCSEKCREEAFNSYHKYECAVVEDLKVLFRGPKPTRMFQLMLRLFWMTLDILIADREGFLRKYQEDLKSYRDPLKVDLKKELHLHVLASDEPDTSSDLTRKGVTQFVTVLMYKVAVEENEAVPVQVRKDNCILLLEIIYKLGLLAKGMCDQSKVDLTCFYPLLQMVNHSCAPNAERLVTGDLCSTILAKRPIKAGEQVTICYFPNGSTDYKDKNKRKALHTEFECHCLGCTLDYPTLSSMEENADLKAQLENIKSKTSGERLELLEKFLQEKDDQFPKRELDEAWNLYKQERLKDFCK